MKFRGRTVIGIAVLAIVAATAAVAAAQTNRPAAVPTGKPIIIGMSIAKTGGFQVFDVALENAAKMAARDINAKGGVLGRPLKIIDFNTNSSLNASAPGAKQLLGQGADFIMGTSDYDFGGPALRVANAAGKLGFGFAGDTKLGFHGIGPLAFNTYQGSPAEGAADADFAYAKGWRKPYTLTDTINSYPATVTKWFTERWKQLTGKDPIGADLFLNSDPSIATQITRLRAANPDVILMSSFPPGGASAIKQIRAAGITVPIVGDIGFDGQYWLSAIPNLSNFYWPKLGSQFGDDPSAARAAFFKAYKKFTGQASLLAAYPEAGYTAVQLIAKGVTDAKTTDGKAVAAVIAKLKNFPALIGPTTYAWKADCNVPSQRPFLFYQVQNGKESLISKGVIPKQVPPFTC